MKKIVLALFVVFLTVFTINIAASYAIVIEQQDENFADSILIPEAEVDISYLIQRKGTFNFLGYPTYPNDIDFDVIADYNLDNFIDYEEFSALSPYRVYCELKNDTSLNKNAHAMNVFSYNLDSVIVLHTSTLEYLAEDIVFEIVLNIPSITSSQLLNISIQGTNFQRDLILETIKNLITVEIADMNWSTNSEVSNYLRLNSNDMLGISYQFNSIENNITLKNYNRNENVSLSFVKENVEIENTYERIVIAHSHPINSEYNIFTVNSNLNPCFKPTYGLANQPLVYSAKMHDVDEYYYPYNYGNNITAEFEGFSYNKTILALEQYQTLCYTNYTNQYGLSEGLFLALDDHQMYQKEYLPLSESEMLFFEHEKRNGNYEHYEDLQIIFAESTLRHVRIENSQNLTNIYVKENNSGSEYLKDSFNHNYQKEFSFLYMYAEVNETIVLAIKYDNIDYKVELYEYSASNNIMLKIEHRGVLSANIFLFISGIGRELFDFSHQAEYSFENEQLNTMPSDWSKDLNAESYILSYKNGHKQILYNNSTTALGNVGIYYFSSAKTEGMIEYYAFTSQTNMAFYNYYFGPKVGFYLGFSSTGRFIACNASDTIELGTYLANNWYHFRIIFNTTNDKFSVYIDNVLKADNFNFLNPQLSISRTTFYKFGIGYQKFALDAYDMSWNENYYLNRNQQFLDFSSNSEKRIILEREAEETYNLEFDIPYYLPREQFESYSHKVSRILIESTLEYNETEFLDLDYYGLCYFDLFPLSYANFEILEDILIVQNDMSELVSTFSFSNDIIIDFTAIYHFNVLSRYSDLYINLNSTISLEFIYLIEEKPDSLISAVFELVKPLLMYLIIPLAFYTRWKLKGAAVGFVLSAIINIITLTIPLFYAIMVLILAVFTAIMLLKQKESEYEAND